MRSDWPVWAPAQYFNLSRRKFWQVIIMDLRDTVVEGDDGPDFTCGHGEHLLVPIIYRYIYLRIFACPTAKFGPFSRGQPH